jgi:uncharacterized membrane protein
MRRQRRLDTGLPIVILLVLIFALTFGLLSLRRLLSFSIAGYDLTNMSQAMWNTAHGRPFVFTFAYPITHRLGVHIEPIFLLIAPLYRIFPRPETLLVLQAVIVASGALPAYWLAQARLRSTMAGIVFALAYLFFPALQSGVLYEFHPSTLTAAFWLFALYFLDQGRTRPLVVASLLALSTKEEMALILALFGGYAILRRRRWRIGLIFVGLGLVWFYVGVFWIQPLFSPSGENVQFSRYAWLGSTPLEMVTSILKSPDKIWLQIWHRARLGDYLLRLLAPVAFMSLFDPLTMMLAAPSFAANLLSKLLSQTRVEEFHYTAPIVPFIIASAVYGVERLRAWLLARLSRWHFSAKVSTFRYLTLGISFVVLGFSCTYQYYRGFSPLSRAFSVPQVTAHHQQGRSLMQLVPANASLLVQPNIAPFFSARSEIYGLPTHISLADYLFLDVSSLKELPNLHEYIRTLVGPESPFGLITANDGYLVMTRHEAPGQPLPDAFYDFARADVSDIQYPTQVKFGEDLEFLGYNLITHRENEADLDLFFRPLRQIGSNYLIALYLLDDQGQFLGATTQEPTTTVWYPTSRWKLGEIVRVQVKAVPWDTSSFTSYQLAVGVLNHPDLWDTSVRLQPAIVDSAWQGWLPADGTLLGIAQVTKVWGIAEGGPHWRQFEVPPPAQSVEAYFKDGIALMGTQLARTPLNPGDQLSVTLYWQATRTVKASYVTFLHLLDSTGQLRAQSDHIPNGALPTYAWTSGEVVPDHHLISLDESISAGEYTLIAGMYDGLTVERLPLLKFSGSAQNNAVVIGKISVR